jgi:hypothetical protein
MNKLKRVLTILVCLAAGAVLMVNRVPNVAVAQSSTAPKVVTVTDRPTGGAIGTAAATVNVASQFRVNQTTAGQTITVPNPTVALGLYRRIVVVNIGTVPFQFNGSPLAPGSSSELTWSGASGAAWVGPTASAGSVALPAGFQFGSATTGVAAGATPFAGLGSAPIFLQNGQAISRASNPNLFALAAAAGGSPAITGDVVSGVPSIMNVTAPASVASVVNGTGYSGTGFANVAATSTAAAVTGVLCSINQGNLAQAKCQVSQTPPAANRGLTAGTNNTFAAGTRSTAVTGQGTFIAGTWRGGGPSSSIDNGPYFASNTAGSIVASVTNGDWATGPGGLPTGGAIVSYASDSATGLNFDNVTRNTTNGTAELLATPATFSAPSNNAFWTAGAGLCGFHPGRRGLTSAVATGSVRTLNTGGRVPLQAAGVGATTLQTNTLVQFEELFRLRAYHCGDMLIFGSETYVITAISGGNASVQTITIAPPLRNPIGSGALPTHIVSAMAHGGYAGVAQTAPLQALLSCGASCFQMSDGTFTIGDIVSCLGAATWTNVTNKVGFNMTVGSVPSGCAGGGVTWLIAPRLRGTSISTAPGITTGNPLGPYVLFGVDSVPSLVNGATLTVGPKVSITPAATAASTFPQANTSTINATATVTMASAATATGTAQTFGAFGPYGQGDGTTTFNVPNLVGRVTLNGLTGAAATVAAGAGQTVVSASNPFIVAG